MAAKGRQPVTAERIQQLCDDLKNRAALLAKVARRMEAKKIKQIEVMNLPMAERGLESFRRFYLGCLREIGED